MAARRVWNDGTITKALNPNFAAMAASPGGRASDKPAMRKVGLMDAINELTGGGWRPGVDDGRTADNGYTGFQAYPRDPSNDNAFGPMDPLTPEAIDRLDGDGHTEPRAFEYQVGWNLPGAGGRETPWGVLRAAANGIGIIRRCLEMRKKDVRTLKWSFGPTEDAINEAYAKNISAGRLDAEQKLREELMPEIKRMRDRWKKPWKANDKDFGDWANAVMEDALVLDGVAIYPRRTLGGEIYDLEYIDATTVKLLLDVRGVRPSPPFPAFQQILYGFPRGEWRATTSTETDERGQEIQVLRNGFSTDQFYYHVSNSRSFTPYGLSPVEMALFDSRLYLQRMKWMLAEYDDGSTPMTWIETAASEDGKTMTLSQQRLWEKAFNAKNGGSTKERHRAKVLPHGWKATQMSTVDERYRPEYDLYLIKLLSSYFGVTATRLGFGETNGLGGSGFHEGQMEVSGELGLKPDTEILTDIINALSCEVLEMDPRLAFAFVDPSAANTAEQAQIQVGNVAAGVLSRNEVRQAQGQSLLPYPEANMQTILSGPQGIIFLDGAKAAVEQAAAAQQMAAETSAMGTAGKLSLEEKKLEDGVAAREEGREFAREEREAEVKKSVEIDAFRRWRRKQGDSPRRPFLFKTVAPDDGWAELDGLGPDVVAYEGWEWLADEDIEKAAKRSKSPFDWIGWNAANPLHPKGPNGRWVKRGSDLHTALVEEGERHAKATAPRADPKYKIENKPAREKESHHVEALRGMTREEGNAYLMASPTATQDTIDQLGLRKPDQTYPDYRAAILDQVHGSGVSGASTTISPMKSEAKAKPDPRIERKREQLNISRDPKDNAAKITALREGVIDAADLYRKIEAGPSGQRRDHLVGRVRFRDNQHGEFQIVDKENRTAGWATRTNRNGDEVWMLHSEDYDGGLHLEGWTDSLSVGADILVSGQHAATGRHDSRRISQGKFEKYVPKTPEQWDRESEQRREREKLEREQRLASLGMPDPAEAAELKAKARMSAIEAARARMRVLGDLEEGLDAEMGTAELRRSTRASVKQHGLGDDEMIAGLAGVVETSIDSGDIRRHMNMITSRLGFERVDTGGNTFDPKAHNPIARGIKAGDPVELVRPGYAMTHEGERILVERPVVQSGSPAPRGPQSRIDELGNVHVDALMAADRAAGYEYLKGLHRGQIEAIQVDLALKRRGRTNADKRDAILDAIQERRASQQRPAMNIFTGEGVEEWKAEVEAYIAANTPKPIVDVRGRTWTHWKGDLFRSEHGGAHTRAQVEAVQPLDVDAARIELAELEAFKANDVPLWKPTPIGEKIKPMTKEEEANTKAHQFANSRIEILRRDIAHHESTHIDPSSFVTSKVNAHSLRRGDMVVVAGRAGHVVAHEEHGSVVTVTLDDGRVLNLGLNEPIPRVHGGNLRKAVEPGEGPGDADPKAQEPIAAPPPPDQRWPGWILDLVIASLVAQALMGALAAPGMGISGLVRRFFEWTRGWVRGDPVPDTRGWLLHSTDTLQRLVEAIEGPIRDAHVEGALVGQRAAQAVLDAIGEAGDARAALELSINWGDWTPGHPEAARALLDAPGLENLLYQSGVTIRGIAEGRLEEIARILSEGLARGDAPNTIARALAEALGNSSWAKMTAVTETNRAMSYAAVQEYRAAGLLYKGWMTAFDQRVCPICKNNESNDDGTPRIVPIDELFPSGDPWPPGHPRCRCAPIPILQHQLDALGLGGNIR